MATNRFLLALLACAILPAATKTICDSGCDYTTANLQTALTDLASCGNHLQLKAQALNEYVAALQKVTGTGVDYLPAESLSQIAKSL